MRNWITQRLFELALFIGGDITVKDVDSLNYYWRRTRDMSHHSQHTGKGGYNCDICDEDRDDWGYIV